MSQSFHQQRSFVPPYQHISSEDSPSPSTPNAAVPPHHQHAPHNHPLGGVTPHQSFNFVDEITVTLQELNKAVENIQFFSESVKSLDLLSMLKEASGSNFKSIIQNIDFEQVSTLLQSPLVRQILSDPEFLAMFMPDTHAEGDSSQKNKS